MNDSLDRKKLVGVIAQQLNILISEDDPIFATVILNELVLKEFMDVASNELAGILVLIKRVEASLDKSTIDATSKLNAQSEKILESLDRLSSEAKEIDNLRIKNLDAAAKSSAEFAIQDSYKRVSEIMDPMIERVTNGIEQSVHRLNESYNSVQKLHIEVAKTVVKSVNEIIIKLNSQRDWTVLYCLLSSTLGSAVTCGIFKWVL